MVDVRVTAASGTSAEWQSSSLVLAVGQLAWETDTRILRVGDGQNLEPNLAIVGGSSPVVTSTANFVSTVSGLLPGSSNAGANYSLLQAAIDSAAQAGGGRVIVPAGTWYSNPLALGTRTCLSGLGWGSILKLANGVNTHFITLKSPTGTEQAGIADIQLDGNKGYQSAGDVVRFDNTGYSNSGSNFEDDVNHWMRRVLLRNGKANGLTLTGARGQGQYEDVWTYHNDANGFYVDSSDNQFTGLISGWSGKQGVYFTPGGSGAHVVRGKSFLSGQVDSTNGDGWITQFTNSIHLVDVEAQDNAGHGFTLVGTANMRLVGISDRNGTGPAFAGSNGDGIYMSGVTDSHIDLISIDRNDPGTGVLQGRGYNFGTGNERNVVRINVGATKTGIAGVGPLSASSDITITSRETSLSLPPVGISDTFDSIDTQKWPTLNGTVTSVSGRMRLATTSGYSNATTDNVVPFMRRPVVVQLATVPSAGTGTTQASFLLTLGSSSIGFTVQDSPQGLHAKCTGLSDVTVPYNATNHKWLRLRYADGTVYWDAAPDASGVPGAWTNLAYQPAPAFVTSGLFRVKLESGFYGTESGLAPAYAEFDNLNLS